MALQRGADADAGGLAVGEDPGVEVRRELALVVDVAAHRVEVVRPLPEVGAGERMISW
jgi:hypothetical protein